MSSAVLSLLAHPDDAEFFCAGVLIRLQREHGWKVHIASMTAGDCGSTQLDAEAISEVRRAEGARAAALIGATYHCLEEKDLQITYNEHVLERVVRLYRAVRPRLVLTHSPADYMLDHEMTSTLARAAAFAAPVPNFLAGRGYAAPLDQVPHLYYCDPAEGKDPLGRAVVPSFLIDISTAIETKAEMLTCHASQREWLLRQHGMDHYVQTMRDWCARNGKGIGIAYAEGFRQHLGHSYPQQDLLGQLLGDKEKRRQGEEETRRQGDET
jgi:LmbE family N-acetylglucosaminyl deacetylase